MNNYNCGTKLKKEIEVEETFIYPIFRKTTDALSAIYWYKETTNREYKKYLQQIKDCIG